MPFSKLKDLDFYINGQSRIVVCFRTYTLGSDLDGCITVTLPKKYTLLQQKGNKTKKTAKVKTKIAKEKTVVKDGCYTFWCNTPYYVDTVCKSGNLTILSNGGTYVSYGKNGWAPYDDTKTYPLISKNFKFKLANKVYRWEGEVPSHKVVKFGVVHYVSQAQNLTKENFAKKEHELHGDHGSHIYLCVLVKNGKVVSVGDGPG